jgi:hypothetical protein
MSATSAVPASLIDLCDGPNHPARPWLLLPDIQSAISHRYPFDSSEEQGKEEDFQGLSTCCRTHLSVERDGTVVRSGCVEGGSQEVARVLATLRMVSLLGRWSWSCCMMNLIGSHCSRGEVVDSLVITDHGSY